MKFSAQILLASLATTAFSHVIHAPSKVVREDPTLVERDLATVTEVLNAVGTDIEALDAAIQAFDGTSGPVVEASEALVTTLTEGKATVDASEQLSLADALGLQGPVADLTDQAEALKDNLVAQRTAIQEAGFCDITREQISSINTASQALIDSVISKVPEAAQDIAEDLAADLRAVLNEAQDAFSEANCPAAAP